MPSGTRVGTAYVDIFPRFDGFLRDVSKGLSKLSNAKELKNLGASLTKSVTLPLAAIGGLSLKAAIDFESAFAGVRKTVDATEPQFAALEQGIRDMAKELPASAVEISKVAEAAGQLGIKQDAILGFTRVMVDLGETTNLTADEAANALARIANIVQLPQDEFDRLGSTIVALGNAGASTESEIVSMALRIAGAGKQVGLTVDQTLAFANALSSVGISAEAGGSAISRVFVGIANEVASGGEKLETFAEVAGVSVEEFQRAFREDAAGALVTFIEGLDRTAKSGGNVFQVLDDLGLSEVRVRDALLRAAGAGDLFRESLELGSKAWGENSALTEEARKRYETFASRLEVFRNKVVDVGISLGRALLPVLESVIDIATPIVGAIAQLVEGFSSLPGPLKAVVGGLVGMAAAAGPVLFVIGKLSLAMKKGGAIHTGLDLMTRGIDRFSRKSAAGATASQRLGRGLSTLGKVAGVAGTLYAIGEAAQFVAEKITDWVEGPKAGPEAVKRAVLDIADGINAARPELKGFRIDIEQVDQALAELVATGQVDQARAAFERFQQAIRGMDLPGFLIPQFKQYEDALIGVENEQRDAANTAGDLGGEVGSLDENIGDTVSTFADAEDAINDWRTALDAALGLLLGVRDAERDYQQAIDDLDAALKENGRTFDINTQAGRDNQAAVDDLITSTKLLVEKRAEEAIKAGQAYDANAEIKRILNQLARNAVPEVREQIRLYIAKLNAIPEEVNTDINLTGLRSAVIGLDNLKAKLDKLDSYDIAIGYVPPPGKAHGGPVESGQTYLVGEKGPELFRPSVSGRIVPNHELMSAEALAPAGAYAGAVFNFNVSGEGKTARQIAYEIERIFDRKLQQVGQRVEARRRVTPRTQAVNG